jgi:S-formylglutathione hydrolase FrmB
MGALWGFIYLAIKHPDVFSATGSMSGLLTSACCSGVWNSPENLGTRQKEYQDFWDQNVIINMLPLIKKDNLSIND